MSRIIESIAYECRTLDAPIQFEHDGRSPGLFTRYLTLKGERAYTLSFSCGTCYFLFTRLGGANATISVAELDALLHCGITQLTPELLQRVAPIIPAGRYRVNLCELTPRLVQPATPDDYFSHEQVALWGVDPFWGLPHYPYTEYYRTDERAIGQQKGLFEFVVPMVPKHWLDEDRYIEYRDKLSKGDTPTAVAIAIFDAKGPAVWEGDPPVTEHYCLAHFLLDGHHKL